MSKRNQKKSKRNQKEIRIWMLKHDRTVDSIRTELGYKNHSPVSNTIAGRANFKRVLGYLKNKGCPVKYLALPKSMGGVA